MENKKFSRFQANNFNKFFSNNPDQKGNDSVALELEFQALLNFMGDIKEKKILDLGCGDGRIGIKLAYYAREVIGYDISEIGVKKANERAASFGVMNFRAEVNDFTNIKNTEEYFDTILCVNMLHHSYDIANTLQQVIHSLRPGGFLIIMENNPINPLFLPFFIIIGQLKAHLTKSFFHVNRFSLTKLISNSGLNLICYERYGWLPTFLYNYSVLFKKLNDAVNRVPIIREMTAFYLYRAEKN